MVVDSAGSSTATKKQLAGKYGMDVELLEKLGRFVNVPSEREMPLGGAGGAGAGAGAGSVRYVGDAESGEDIVVREVSLLFDISALNFSYFSLIYGTGRVEGANTNCYMMTSRRHLNLTGPTT